MNDFAKRLKVILDANGNELIEDTDSLRRLLLRGQPDGPPEVRTLVLMAERGAVQHLFRWAKTPTEQRPAYVQMRDHIAQKFATAGVLPASEVRWALDAWVDALPALAQHARQAPPQAPSPVPTPSTPAGTLPEPSVLPAATSLPAATRASAGAESPASARATPGTPELVPLASPPPSAAPTRAARSDSTAAVGKAAPRNARASSAESPVYRNRLLAPMGTPDDELEAADDAAPMAPAPTPTGARMVSPLRGFGWYADAWRLFVAHPFLWWGCLLVFLILSVAPAIVPVIGEVIALLLSPILLAGVLLGAHAVDQGEPLRVGHVFAGFRKNPLGLILTVILQVGMIGALAVAMAFWLGGSALLGLMQTTPSDDPAEALAWLYGLGPLMILQFVVLFLVLVAASMSMYFAAPLVAIRNENPVRAVWLSMTGLLKNVLAGLVHTLASLALALLATIPLGLGWLVLPPIMMLTLYAAFRDIYLEP